MYIFITKTTSLLPTVYLGNSLIIGYSIGKIWYPFNGLNGWWLTQLARS